MIISVGDVLTDVLAELHARLAHGSDAPATIRVSGGGQAANTAAWLAVDGAEVTFVGMVGDDRAGLDRLTELRAAGVRTQVGVRPGVATGTVVVLVHGTERTMITDRGANALLDPADVRSALRDSEAGHLHLSGYPLLDETSRPAALEALRLARTAGLTTSVDAGSAAPLRAAGTVFLDWIRGVDVLFANEAEVHALTGPGDPTRQAVGVAAAIGGAVVVKLGSDGAVWVGGDGPPYRAAAEQVGVVDSTGAGDAFAAGFLSAWTRGAEAGEAIHAGCRLGTRAVLSMGARPDIE